MKPRRNWFTWGGLFLGIALITSVILWSLLDNAGKITSWGAILIGISLLISGFAAGWLAAMRLVPQPEPQPKTPSPNRIKEQAQRQFHELVKTMSHEISKIYRPFEDNLHVAEDHANSLSGEFGPYIRNDLHKISSLHWRLRRALEKWWQWSDIEADRYYLDLDFRPINLETITEEVTTQFQLRAQEKDNTLSWQRNYPHDQELPLISADEDALRQMLYNLVHNAIKFTTNGTIRIVLEADQDREVVRLLVKDNGKGIAEGDRSNIFKSEFTGDRQQGRGIGLYVVKKIVDEHRGCIEVNSQLGEGTTFTVTFPTSRE